MINKEATIEGIKEFIRASIDAFKKTNEYDPAKKYTEVVIIEGQIFFITFGQGIKLKVTILLEGDVIINERDGTLTNTLIGGIKDEEETN